MLGPIFLAIGIANGQNGADGCARCATALAGEAKCLSNTY